MTSPSLVPKTARQTSNRHERLLVMFVPPLLEAKRDFVLGSHCDSQSASMASSHWLPKLSWLPTFGASAELRGETEEAKAVTQEPITFQLSTITPEC